MSLISATIRDGLYADEVSNFSLLSDKGLGTILYLSYDQSLNNFDHSKKIQQIFNTLSVRLESEEIKYDFGSGLAGFGWLISHLNKNNLLEIEVTQFLSDLDRIVYNNGLQDLKINEHDFFFGGIGAMIYHLERCPDNNMSSLYLSDLVVALKDKSLTEKKSSYWATNFSRLSGPIAPKILTGMAHGQASKIFVLTQLFLADISKPFVRELLLRSLEFLLVEVKKVILESKTKEDSYHTSNVFGHSIHPWCNGDLGIASAIWQAGYALRDKIIMEEATNIFIKSCSKKSDGSVFEVWDAGICHGSTGIALMYNRMYKNTGIISFLEESKLWLDKTSAFKIFDDGIGGYKKKVFTDETNNWEVDSGFLNGSSGIGLGVLSCSSDNDYAWDRCLLLC